MSDLISRSLLDAELQKAQESLESGDDSVWKRNRGHFKGLAWARRIAQSIPAAMDTPDSCGTWETRQFYDGDGNAVYIHRHHECKYELRSYKEHGTPYCPNCGVKMDGGAEG